MKLQWRRLVCAFLSVILFVPPGAVVHAEDTDLFVGNPASAVQQPNVLVIIDSSDNWAANNQNWPSEFQGQAELSAFADVLNVITTENIGIGLMLMTAGVGNDASDAGWQNKDGAYVRFAIRKMDATNKAALREMLLGTNPSAASPTPANCVDGPNSLMVSLYGATATGPRNCIYKNAASGALKEGVGSNVDYGAAMFEAFKYFGGGDGTATASRTAFGPVRYSGNPDGRDDPGAFNPTSQRSVYKPPIDETNNCAKNYIIFVGNGFPNQNNSGTVLSNVNAGNTTQLEMAEFSEGFKTDSLGDFSDGICRTLNQCASAVATEFSGNTTYETFSCRFKEGVTTTDGCKGSAAKNWEKIGIDQDVTVVSPTGNAVTPPAASVPIRYADEWAQFLATHDVNPATGVQNVQTYTIDVFKDQPDKDETSLLFSMAKYGQGKYFQATDLQALKDAFETIFNEILAENSVFAAASLPVSATNRAQNENQVFFGLFRPDKDSLPRWYGNLKRYQIARDPNDATQLILADQFGANAVNNSSGFFEPCAGSFWTTDTGTYWQFAALATNCAVADRPATSTNEFSDLPDGEQVEKGGAAHVLRAGNLSTARVMKTCVSETDCSSLIDIGTIDASGNVTATSLTPDRFGLTSTDTSTRDKIVQYTYGRDVGLLSGDPAVVGEKVSDSDGDATATRPSVHGDVVHSRPLPVNYGGSTGIVAYYGTNDGLLRAVQTGDANGTGGGKELWSFIAPEHHSKLKRLRNNSEPISYPGTPDPSALPKDYFFDGTIGLYQNADNSKVMIFPAMRRGGRMLYGFDVTTPASPILKWRVGCTNADLNDTASCTSTDFEGIGQTWSTPNVAFIKGFDDPNNPADTTTGAVPVVVVGGGYDTCEDEDVKGPTCSSPKGNKVYVLNAFTGAVIAKFDTDRSVAADVALVERNFDGAVDHAYVVDTGGNVYRIDFVDPADASSALAPADWEIHKIASVGSGSGKKFLFPPSVLPIKVSGQEMIILTLGSGDRERPLVVNYPVNASKGGPVTNSFYAFVDKLETDVTLALDDTSAADSVKIYKSTDDTSDPDRIPDSKCLPEIRGWRKDLTAGTGEQTVTSSLVTQGRVFFNTHTATSPEAGQCNSLGDARGYNQDLFCGGGFFVQYEQGGLPISPVQGTTTLADGSVVTFCIGCATDPDTTNPYTPGPIKPVISPVRSRLYWYREQDK